MSCWLVENLICLFNWLYVSILFVGFKLYFDAGISSWSFHRYISSIELTFSCFALLLLPFWVSFESHWRLLDSAYFYSLSSKWVADMCFIRWVRLLDLLYVSLLFVEFELYFDAGISSWSFCRYLSSIESGFCCFALLLHPFWLNFKSHLSYWYHMRFNYGDHALRSSAKLARCFLTIRWIWDRT